VRIIVTGADGFLGSNLRVRLRESGHDVAGITRSTTREQLEAALVHADFVFHAAGVNRPKQEREFHAGNVGFTQTLGSALLASGRRTPVVYASSTQATLDNPYGRSKRAAEDVLLRYGREAAAPIYIFRLTNVFGKWCRPNYNSVVATFCHRLARDLPVTVNDPAVPLRLVYVDDVMDAWIALFADNAAGGYREARPVYDTTVGQVAELLRSFVRSRTSLQIPRVGIGLVRALYATYISYLPPTAFSYEIAQHADPRGAFAEVLKTPDCGQFSYFTAHPGVTRGEHYHHSKTEKFLVLRGTAQFAFRHIATGETHELVTCGGEPRIVDSVPGWAHNVTNIGQDELVVMLWANEVFDRARPDTVAMKVRA
jgi:UDP-2-acetamido-2,6-beta-L-arabino-hexul-4-ose reductase